MKRIAKDAETVVAYYKVLLSSICGTDGLRETNEPPITITGLQDLPNMNQNSNHSTMTFGQRKV